LSYICPFIYLYAFLWAKPIKMAGTKVPTTPQKPQKVGLFEKECVRLLIYSL